MRSRNMDFEKKSNISDRYLLAGNIDDEHLDRDARRVLIEIIPRRGGANQLS